MAEARKTLPKVLRQWGHDSIMMEASATGTGAVETPHEGRLYAEFLAKNRGKFDGVILSLPNFGDETGAVAALERRRCADLHPGLSGRTGQDGAGGAPRCLLRQVLDYGCLLAERCQVHHPQTAYRRPHQRPLQGKYRLFRQRLPGLERHEEHGRRRHRRAHHRFQDRAIDEVALQRNGITMETFDLLDVYCAMNKLSSRRQSLQGQEPSC